MSKSFKKKHSKFTFQSLIRLAIFSIVVFFIISFVSGQKLNSSKVIDNTLSVDEKESSSILGKTTEIGNDIYQSIPPSSRQQLENFNETPFMIFIQEKIDLVKQQSQGFPQKQIKEIQKMVAKSIYENTIKNIDSNLFSSIYSAIFRCAGGRMLRLFSMFLQPMKVPPQFIEDYAFTSHTSTSLLKK